MTAGVLRRCPDARHPDNRCTTVCVCGAPMVGGTTPNGRTPWRDCRDREDARERTALARCAAIEADAKAQAAAATAYEALRDLMAARTHERAVELRHTSWRTAA